MTKYTVKPGKTNFRPLEPWTPIHKAKGFEVEFTIRPGGWCSQEEWEGDNDWQDWWKLKGLTRCFSANNKQSALVGFRFGKDPGTYEVCGYLNDKDGGWKASPPVKIYAGKSNIITCVFEKGKAWYIGKGLNWSTPFDTPKLFRETGTYAGGADNGDGVYGGYATKEMNIDIEFKILK